MFDRNIRQFWRNNMDLWQLANEKRDLLRFSTLFTAQNVRDLISTREGLEEAIRWCRDTAVTHVFVESFRNGYTAERDALERAKQAFLDAGIDVSGCVTTTKVGKQSTGWNLIDCYTDRTTQEHLQQIFEYTASLFDEIMIDDFLFTDCECEACQAARGDRSWVEYRCDLMVQVSRERILRPAKSVNPNVQVIIKYPQWYDNFHNRGYEVVRETADFDRIWVGTETRDPDNERWGRKAQYEAYFIMRWLGQIGGNKTGGGWFDPYGTSPPTYVEQARQTVLADAKEALLFCYGSLLRDTGPANVDALRREVPALFDLAAFVRDQPIRGILAPKPPNSDPGREPYVFDFVGMLGLPLVPTPEIEGDAEVMFLSTHALKDSDLDVKLDRLLRSKTPLLVTDGLKAALESRISLDVPNVQTLGVRGEPRSLLNLDRTALNALREPLLRPWNCRFDAPNRVALYLIGDGVVVENFNDEPVETTLSLPGGGSLEPVVTLPVGAQIDLSAHGDMIDITIPPRGLIALSGSRL